MKIVMVERAIELCLLMNVVEVEVGSVPRGNCMIDGGAAFLPGVIEHLRVCAGIEETQNYFVHKCLQMEENGILVAKDDCYSRESLTDKGKIFLEELCGIYNECEEVHHRGIVECAGIEVFVGRAKEHLARYVEMHSRERLSGKCYQVLGILKAMFLKISSFEPQTKFGKSALLEETAKAAVFAGMTFGAVRENCTTSLGLSAEDFEILALEMVIKKKPVDMIGTTLYNILRASCNDFEEVIFEEKFLEVFGC